MTAGALVIMMLVYRCRSHGKGDMPKVTPRIFIKEVLTPRWFVMWS